MHQADPYNEREFTRLYLDATHRLPQVSNQRTALAKYVNLPTALLLVAPFAVLPWSVAKALWIGLVAGGFLGAAFLIWRLGDEYASGASLTLVCIVLLNSEVLFATGDTAGIVISLTVIAVWSFLNDRHIALGIICFAVALALKPHDAGILWLYFFLAGRVHRTRALRALAITSSLLACAIFWVSRVAPHWFSELLSNISASSTPGGLHEPGLASLTGRTAAMVIDLQAVTSAIWVDPHLYNLASYLVCGILICLWAFTTIRSTFSVSNAWLAVAAAVPLTLLITYHRPYDAKLLLLTIPACTMLWAEGGLRGWLALGFTTAGIVVTGDFFLAALTHITRHLDLAGASPAHRIFIGVAAQPVPLVLLVLAVFYLSIYMRQARKQRDPEHNSAVQTTHA
ncbi:MAG: glycosyltransferase family 87 protein [Terracidiphilus sp.]